MDNKVSTSMGSGSKAEKAISGLAGDLQENVPSRQEVQDWVNTGVDSVKSKLKSATEGADGFVRDRPYITLACGIAVGLAGGLLIANTLSKST